MVGRGWTLETAIARVEKNCRIEIRQDDKTKVVLSRTIIPSKDTGIKTYGAIDYLCKIHGYHLHKAE